MSGMIEKAILKKIVEEWEVFPNEEYVLDVLWNEARYWGLTGEEIREMKKKVKEMLL